MQLVPRSSWGARAYRTPNGATPYSGSRRGVKVHYLGGAYSDRPHGQCAAYVRQVQKQHMDGNGWSDIGYSFVVCTHGYVYEGRGLKRRNSANGNTSLNNQDYAVLALVGSSGLTKPTDAQLHGLRDAIEHCRKSGPAGTWVGGHRDGYATACPGQPLYDWVKKGAPRPNSTSPTPEKGLDMDAKQVNAAVWNQDSMPAPPSASTYKTNKTWKASSYFKETYERIHEVKADLASIQAKLDAQAKTIDKLADALGSAGQFDPETLKREIREAIESVTVRLDTT